MSEGRGDGALQGMANQKDDFKARLLATFRVEAQEHLQAITANLLKLERDLAPAEAETVVEATFRQVHTLKGAARSVGQMEVEALCQACESVLSRVTRSQLVLTPPILNRLQIADQVRRRMFDLGKDAWVQRDRPVRGELELYSMVKGCCPHEHSLGSNIREA